MLLKHRLDRILVEVLDLPELWNPFAPTVLARYLAGEELQDPELFGKADLVFPSGELLPQCWLDPHYRDQEILAHHPGQVLAS
jgi:hypothetical protein